MLVRNRLLSSIFQKSILILFASFAALAVAEGDAPHPVVKKTTDALVAALNENPQALKDNPEGYEKIVEEILIPIVDFETFIKIVMDKKYYQAATPEQRTRFQQVFKESLVSTYSTGLSIFDSQEITLLPENPADQGKSMRSVKMEVRTSEGTIFPLNFTMRKNSAGEWKCMNVVLNGVNVAKAYRSHFAESMAKHGENMDELIANWNAKISTEQPQQASN